MPCKRCRFARHPFHHAAVTAERVDAEVEHLVVGFVKICGLPLSGDRHSHTGRDSLAQRARRSLHARGPAIFRMTWTLAIELAKTLDVVESYGRFADLFVVGIDRLDAGEVQ